MRTDDPDALIEKGNVVAENLEDHAHQVKETAEQLLETSRKYALQPSEVLGGVAGGAALLAGGLGLVGAGLIVAYAVPALTVAGIVGGILVVRGTSGIALDRRNRNAGVTLDASMTRMEAIRKEIEAAIKLGAPPSVRRALWAKYVASAPSPEPSLELPSKQPQLSLPAGDETET